MPDPTARAMPDPTAFETAFEAAGHRLARPRRVLAGLIEARDGALLIQTATFLVALALGPRRGLLRRRRVASGARGG
jgi:hypothetical protein